MVLPYGVALMLVGLIADVGRCLALLISTTC